MVALLTVGVLPASQVAALDTNNFRISSFDTQYELSRDSEGRSVLKTTETITAEFPTVDQNHGLERAIPAQYDGHPTNLSIQSVTNANGDSLEYSTKNEDDMTIVRIGDPDAYVHGSQTYKITYTQRDVTRFFEDTDRDEWYWDINGTEWQVPIDQLTATFTLDASLRDAREGTPACYQGVNRATTACDVSATGENTYTVAATNLAAGENVTVAFGFQPNTFAAYEMTFAERVLMMLGVLQVVTIPLAILAVIIFGVKAHRRQYRKAEEDPIVAEYIPPKDASVMVSSQVLTAPQSPFSAQLIDLAVRHFISIVETKEKKLFRSADYDIVIKSDISPLRDEEKELLRDMFGKTPKVGESVKLSSLRYNTSYTTRTLDNDKKLKKLIEGNYAIREKSPTASRLFYKWAIVLLILAILTLSIALLVATFIVWILGLTLRPLTNKGLALRRYVLGLDRYIKASEAERLKFLQGPDTAEKVGHSVDTENPGQLVKLYERALPYAILFGREKDWAKRLGDIYDQAQTAPDWYTGNTVFNAAIFASTLNSFSTAASYSGGASSSPSGGSSGGGSSGGGGGGGGGGGW